MIGNLEAETKLECNLDSETESSRGIMSPSLVERSDRKCQRELYTNSRETFPL